VLERAIVDFSPFLGQDGLSLYSLETY